MLITVNRITILAQLLLLPALLIGAFAIDWVPLTAPLSLSTHFGLGYATLVAMVIAFRRRSAAGLASVVGTLLVMAWAIDPTPDGPSRVIATLAGVLCAMLPAFLRDWQRLAGENVHMNLSQLRVLWRRKKRRSSSRASASQQGHVYLLPAPQTNRSNDSMHASVGTGERGRSTL